MGNVQNANADKGFNNFLACIEGLEYFNEPSKKGSTIEIDVIETYIRGLMYICSSEFKNKLQSLYNGLYTGWFDSFVHCLWNEINTYDGKWDIIDPRGGNQEIRNDYKNKSIARNKSMLFWSWMTYFKKCKGAEIDDQLLVRLLHFYYIRFQCYKRSATSIETIVNAFINKSGRIHEIDIATKDEEEEDNINSKTFSDEEVLLSSLCFADEANTSKIESCIWEIQELPYFLDGKGVGGNTIFEFFQDKEIIDRDNILNSITSFKDKIISLLGIEPTGTSHIDIKKILLFYEIDNKAFWEQQSPWYYSNYETCEWKRIVRTKHFISFYKEFFKKDQKSQELLQQKRSEFFKENNTLNRNEEQWSHRKLAILYDLLSINEGIWDDNYANVAFGINDEEPKSEIFLEQDIIWKAKRYRDTNNRIALSQDWQKILKEYNVEIIDFDEKINDSKEHV